MVKRRSCAWVGKRWRSDPADTPASAATARTDTRAAPSRRITRQAASTSSTLRASWSISLGTTQC
jgi:hypothetical protein